MTLLRLMNGQIYCTKCERKFDTQQAHNEYVESLGFPWRDVGAALLFIIPLALLFMGVVVIWLRGY